MLGLARPSPVRSAFGGLMALALLLALGCSKRSSSGDGGDGAEHDAASDTMCKSSSAHRLSGQACACASDCATGFCVDGVCCSSSCTETCKTCAANGSLGTCTFVSAGAAPRNPSTCAAADASTCGFDGKCDGAGACRKFAAGTECKKGSCDGAAVVGAFVCDGKGRCKQAPETICTPFSCDPSRKACYDQCTQTSDCAGGQECVNRSCGARMKGASCNANGECGSGFCADHVCCNVACQGACVSCAMAGRLGTCWPIDAALPDPRGICKDLGGSSCGTDGRCDGFGGCEKYAPETQCIAPSCTGTRRNTPGTCDGKGTCREPGVQNCSPFLCSGGTCTSKCMADEDCDSGHACVDGSCGPKQNGIACAAGGECMSGHCVDGVCCDAACSGACRSCALPSAPGKCMAASAGGADPRGTCADQGAASCGANGKCDGAGGCQKYKAGTLCAVESCSGNVYQPPSICSATGQCTAPDSLTCAPYTCNGSKCYASCTADANCTMPNVCAAGSCGKAPLGASCSSPAECQSGSCAQGVCCASACTGACKSCALAGSLGVCANLPTDAVDSAGICIDQGPVSCGTNGRCQSGSCQKYSQGTSCKDPTCAALSTTFTAASTCDGAGTCGTPAPSSCVPYRCGVGACKNACAIDADCAPPAVCANGSCGLKSLGKICADGGECASSFCAQGVCCDAACTEACRSCALSASLGTCTNVLAGAPDPQATCTDEGAASCGKDGVCDGRGACRLYVGGTQCAAPSCAAGSSTLTLAKTCDGSGSCQSVGSQSCAPYACNSTSTCKSTCMGDTDCVAPDICDLKTSACGNHRRLGQTCTSAADCLTGDFCTQGVCCDMSVCPTCQSCVVTGLVGTCSNVAAGDADPTSSCTDKGAALCGTNGRCDGSGACQLYGVSTMCAGPSCPAGGTQLTSARICDGAGHCRTATTSDCGAYSCDGAAACNVACTDDSQCATPADVCDTNAQQCGPS